MCHYNPQLVGNINIYTTPQANELGFGNGQQQQSPNRQPDDFIHTTPINVGGIKISLGSTSDDRVNPLSQFHGTDSSDWEDPSLGKSGYGKSKSGMSRDCDTIVPISLDFSPPSLRTPEARARACSDVDIEVDTPKTSLTFESAPFTGPMKRGLDDDGVQTEMVTMNNKKHRVQEWMNIALVTQVTDCPEESFPSESTVTSEASSGSNGVVKKTTVLDFFPKKTSQ